LNQIPGTTNFFSDVIPDELQNPHVRFAINHQPTILFSQNKPATSTSFHNKSASATNPTNRLSVER
jgi:hypothetical protein